MSDAKKEGLSNVIKSMPPFFEQNGKYYCLTLSILPCQEALDKRWLAAYLWVDDNQSILDGDKIAVENTPIEAILKLKSMVKGKK